VTIIEESYAWAYPLSLRSATTHLILHHAACSGSAQQIHQSHLKNGWSGIGYHYYVRKDGSIYRGRPENMRGAHTTDWNWCSIGVCFEGNLETETMNARQKAAGLALVADLRRRYPGITICGHRDLNATACPGKNFPLDEMKKAEEQEELMTGEEIYKALSEYLATQEAPDWAADELAEAVELGLTDGTEPMALIPRYQAAILTKRALQKARKEVE